MGCMYCEENENLALLMAPICELPSSRVYLFRNQAYRGRCVVAAGNHAGREACLPGRGRDSASGKD